MPNYSAEFIIIRKQWREIMKRGFSLVELLIVMVIVGILVTIALPKYRVAMERGRAVEGIANLKAASDWINAKYVMNGNAYPDNEDLVTVVTTANSSSLTMIGSLSKNIYFTSPVFIDCTSDTDRCIQSSRQQGNEVYYTLTAYNTAGELKKIVCTGTEKKLCEPLGMTLDDNGNYELLFSDD